MSLKQKYAENESKIKELLGVPIDEPIFILRAQDKHSTAAIQDYRSLVFTRTIIGNYSTEWDSSLGSIINDFINWQRDNRSKVKEPD